jgi:hypothetical protein
VRSLRGLYPSASLYTFRRCIGGSARRCHARKGEGFSEFPHIPTGVSYPAAPFDESPALTVELRAPKSKEQDADHSVFTNTASSVSSFNYEPTESNSPINWSKVARDVGSFAKWWRISSMSSLISTSSLPTLATGSGLATAPGRVI